MWPLALRAPRAAQPNLANLAERDTWLEQNRDGSAFMCNVPPLPLTVMDVPEKDGDPITDGAQPRSSRLPMPTENFIAPGPANQHRPFMELSWTDRLLTPAILVSMIVGVVIGEFAPGVQQAFDVVQFRGVSTRSYMLHFCYKEDCLLGIQR